MGTIKSSESLALAEYLRAQRTTTQAEVDSRSAQHAATARYELRMERTAPGAH